ncbi:divalent-cation tolerance protein CutA [Alcaligenaceae bacterium]|nr:divalent-cation tolerance protein CutA [Alcaligenaceae bacterium]
MISAPSLSASDVVIVLGNAPDLLLAKRIAHMLVEEHLAACVNLGASGLSMYMWQEELQGSDEIPLTMKTSGLCVHALIQRYTELHPHDVPEVLILPVLGGTTDYLNWVVQQTTPE